MHLLVHPKEGFGHRVHLDIPPAPSLPTFPGKPFQPFLFFGGSESDQTGKTVPPFPGSDTNNYFTIGLACLSVEVFAETQVGINPYRCQKHLYLTKILIASCLHVNTNNTILVDPPVCVEKAPEVSQDDILRGLQYRCRDFMSPFLSHTLKPAFERL